MFLARFGRTMHNTQEVERTQEGELYTPLERDTMKTSLDGDDVDEFDDSTGFLIVRTYAERLARRACLKAAKSPPSYIHPASTWHILSLGAVVLALICQPYRSVKKFAPTLHTPEFIEIISEQLYMSALTSGNLTTETLSSTVTERHCPALETALWGKRGEALPEADQNGDGRIDPYEAYEVLSLTVQAHFSGSNPSQTGSI